jgi:hypothetical protein
LIVFLRKLNVRKVRMMATFLSRKF